jgi:hypothetical protein
VPLGDPIRADDAPLQFFPPHRPTGNTTTSSLTSLSHNENIKWFIETMYNENPYKHRVRECQDIGFEAILTAKERKHIANQIREKLIQHNPFRGTSHIHVVDHDKPVAIRELLWANLNHVVLTYSKSTLPFKIIQENAIQFGNVHGLLLKYEARFEQRLQHLINCDESKGLLGWVNFGKMRANRFYRRYCKILLDIETLLGSGGILGTNNDGTRTTTSSPPPPPPQSAGLVEFIKFCTQTLSSTATTTTTASSSTFTSFSTVLSHIQQWSQYWEQGRIIKRILFKLNKLMDICVIALHTGSEYDKSCLIDFIHYIPMDLIQRVVHAVKHAYTSTKLDDDDDNETEGECSNDNDTTTYDNDTIERERQEVSALIDDLLEIVQGMWNYPIQEVIQADIEDTIVSLLELYLKHTGSDKKSRLIRVNLCKEFLWRLRTSLQTLCAAYSEEITDETTLSDILSILRYDFNSASHRDWDQFTSDALGIMQRMCTEYYCKFQSMGMRKVHPHILSVPDKIRVGEYNTAFVYT